MERWWCPLVEAIQAWASEQGVALAEDLGGRPGDAVLLKRLMQECNRLLKARSGSRGDERLAGVVLVDSSGIENGLLTQTLKQRRDRITARDAALIEQLYGRLRGMVVEVIDLRPHG